MLALVAEQTGYPPEMLDLDLDLEADLGVDTVKQAEMFAAVREAYGIERDDKLKLRDYPTLRHVIGFVRDRAPAASMTAPSRRSQPRPPVVSAPVVPVPVVRLSVMRWRRGCWRWWPSRRAIRRRCWTWIWIWRRIWASTR